MQGSIVKRFLVLFLRSAHSRRKRKRSSWLTTRASVSHVSVADPAPRFVDLTVSQLASSQLQSHARCALPSILMLAMSTSTPHRYSARTCRLVVPSNPAWDEKVVVWA